ncbi:TetR/AcrR family transcriptional regulator [Actinomadura opuntiae]|uniref:TetR/AcrR family transcriptional regulator n=1 Tax=Actinomadura sp. OS1-43 TaxID=604315 RepID=UPI00255ACA0F|nr:TetR/AcrR family transcriptional regulator [Actinomadura sp. OS1-43]MDL4820059.1 TetR/AcrR family transcriptional regulator [Actinomadura sp. OS1-43]
MSESSQHPKPDETAGPAEPSGRGEARPDQRLVRGARSRRTIARHAVDVASLEGLSGLSFGRLAADLNISKSNIQTLFRSKENLQLAAVESAREAFVDAVVRPAKDAPRGAARLRALVEHWIVYAATPLFPGGCFRVANLVDFDSRPGPVRDELLRDQQEWVGLIAHHLRVAADAGQIADLDADLAAFQIDAVLCAANTAMRLGDADAADKVHRVIDGFLRPPRS